MGLNGFTRSITLDSGVTLTAAYYKATSLRLHSPKTNKRATFAMEVWASKAAYDLGKPPVMGVPGPTNFVVIDTDFDTWFASSVLAEEGADPLAQAYLYAKAQINDPAIVDVND